MPATDIGKDCHTCNLCSVQPECVVGDSSDLAAAGECAGAGAEECRQCPGPGPMVEP